jgi:ssDNA-binding Zn-finger/Zn-ribbon topoisomerase 1
MGTGIDFRIEPTEKTMIPCSRCHKEIVLRWAKDGTTWGFGFLCRTCRDILQGNSSAETIICPTCGAELETLTEDGMTWQFCLNCGPIDWWSTSYD